MYFQKSFSPKYIYSQKCNIDWYVFPKKLSWPVSDHEWKYIFPLFQILDRSHSMGALNFGYVSDDGILRGSVTPFMHFAHNNESKQSLGQYSDHIDEYRDVALWYVWNSIYLENKIAILLEIVLSVLYQSYTAIGVLSR